MTSMSYGAEKKGEQPFDFHLMRSISINLGLFRKITPLSNEPNSLSLQPRREKAKRYILVTCLFVRMLSRTEFVIL